MARLGRALAPIGLRSRARRLLRPMLDRYPRLKQTLRHADDSVGLLHHVAAAAVPALIQPRPERITVAVTASCNLRCTGCRYGRDFMPGQQLPLALVRDLLADARAAGISTVRLYGGEPLLHPDLPEMVRHACSLGIRPFITTNGRLLDRTIDPLYEAGLRQMTIGYYGTGADYDAYVGATSSFQRLERGVSTVRDRYGSTVDMQLNFLLMRPTCSVKALHQAWEFAERHSMTFQVDLVHYSLPYFTEGPNRALQFTRKDEPQIQEVVAELVALKREHPYVLREPMVSIRSITDWLLKGPGMRVPCDAYRMIWVGADGTVQLCYVTFRLGNLYQQRLRDMMFSEAHKAAARGAFALSCPNCHCERSTRIQKHYPSRIKYAPWTPEMGSSSAQQWPIASAGDGSIC